MLYPAELRARVARSLARQHPKASPGRRVFSRAFQRVESLIFAGHLLRPDRRRNRSPPSLLNQSINQTALEETMTRLAIAMLLVASPAFAQGTAAPEALRDCPPIGQTAKGEMVY